METMGVRFGRFVAFGAGQVPVETQGCLDSLGRPSLHLSSLRTPTPPFPLERLLVFDSTLQTLNSNQLQQWLDLKTYPLKPGNRERAPLLT